MATEFVQVPVSDLPVPPGDILAEELESRGITRAAFARLTGRPAQAISEIVHARKRITADTALDFEAALGVSARFWLNLQTTYDLALAKQRRTAQGDGPQAAGERGERDPGEVGMR